MPKLSIIVPVYDVEQYIHKCVDSILNQTFRDFELILVDDGSPDNCGAICDEYAKKDNRVKVIHKENGGLSDARNWGIDVAQCEIIGFVDSDDYIDKDMYSDMISYLEENKCDIVCCDLCSVRGEKKKFRLSYSEHKIFLGKDAVNEILNVKLDNSAPSKIFKRNVIGEIRFPIGRVYEDVATTYKFVFNAEKVGYIPNPYYYYLKREGSIISSSFNEKSRYDCFLGYKERLEFCKKHNLECIHDCEWLALKNALSALTAFYAKHEDKISDRFVDVYNFIKEYKNFKHKQMHSKHKFLLWCFNNCKQLYISYAKLYYIVKKIKSSLQK